MSRPRISIALATYNGARYLQEQLDSLTAQSRLPDEIVVSDDASSDGTMGILEAFRAAAPFEVKIHRNGANLGYSPNFEIALSRCTGDIIFMSDQDDVWFPEKIETVARLFEEDPGVMVVSHDNIITSHDLAHDGVTKLQNIRSLGLMAAALRTGCATALRRRWLDIALPIPHPKIPYDLWINGLADLLGVRRILPQPLLYYRRHETNVSGWIASTPNHVSWLALVHTYGLADVRAAWSREADATREYIECLEARAEEVRQLDLGAAAERSLDELRRRVEAIAARTGVVSRPRLFRAPHVLRFFLAGGYDHFFGWKSAAKDLIRP